MKHKFHGKLLAAFLAASMLILPGCSEDNPIHPAIGGDWRTWRGYTDDLVISPHFSVTFSLFTAEQDPNCKGYAMYSAETGERMGTILLSREDTEKLDGSVDLLAEDRDGDGMAEIGVPLTDGSVLWYRFNVEIDWLDNVLELAERTEP